MVSDQSPSFKSQFKQYRKRSGLSQQEVADRINVGISIVQKYEQGTRVPPKDTVDLLISALELPPEAKPRFRAAADVARLATSRRRERQAPSPTAIGDSQSSYTKQFGAKVRRALLHRHRILVALGVCILLIVGLTLVVTTLWSPSILPGGWWIRPANGERFRTSLLFAAYAYPNKPNDPPIAHVNFTVTWKGRSGRWIITCSVFKPIKTDEYECLWTPKGEIERVPVGKLSVSFDVFDQNGNYHKAPNGVRTVYYIPTRGNT